MEGSGSLELGLVHKPLGRGGNEYRIVIGETGHGNPGKDQAREADHV